jgi:hypothetical protein
LLRSQFPGQHWRISIVRLKIVTHLRFHFIEALLPSPGSRTNIDWSVISFAWHIGMVDLGFTIIPQCGEGFQARVRASAPREGVPDVDAGDTEKIAEAYMRYSWLIGLLGPATCLPTWMSPTAAILSTKTPSGSWRYGAAWDARPSALISIPRLSL